jgi:hypothetical protein
MPPGRTFAAQRESAIFLDRTVVWYHYLEQATGTGQVWEWLTMQINRERGAPFVNVHNLRITLVRKEDGWAGPEYAYYIRIQAYKGDPEELGPLNQGPELPVAGHADVLRLIQGICLVAEEMPCTPRGR